MRNWLSINFANLSVSTYFAKEKQTFESTRLKANPRNFWGPEQNGTSNGLSGSCYLADIKKK